MLSKRGEKEDAGEVLTGRCGTCGAVVECERWEATKPKSDYLGLFFDDRPYVECKGCAGSKGGPRVYLGPKFPKGPSVP
jgi:hypothetical protein